VHLCFIEHLELSPAFHYLLTANTGAATPGVAGQFVTPPTKMVEGEQFYCETRLPNETISIFWLIFSLEIVWK
jgi:hypothetical protein